MKRQADPRAYRVSHSPKEIQVPKRGQGAPFRGAGRRQRPGEVSPQIEDLRSLESRVLAGVL